MFNKLRLEEIFIEDFIAIFITMPRKARLDMIFKLEGLHIDIIKQDEGRT